jgi:hypothetical protein
MIVRIFGAIALAVGLFASDAARAQQQPAPAAPPNLDAVPDKMPFATPYGSPITMERAQVLIQAAVAEADQHGWAMNVAVGRFQRRSRQLCANERRTTRLD